jgi:CheY-like chemotaxis protein
MKVLVAEDEKDIAASYRDMFKKRGYDFQIALDGAECVKIYKKEAEHATHENGKSTSPLPFDVVILDYKMPRMNGMEAAKEILEIHPRQRIMFISAVVEDMLEDSVKNLGRIVELVRKPFDPKGLVETVEDAEVYRMLEKMNKALERLIAANPDSDQLVELLAALRKIMKGRTF